MLKLSDNYIKAMKQPIVQDIRYGIEIDFGLIDRQSMQKAVCSGDAVFDIKTTDNPLTMLDVPVKKQYASFEKDFYRLDDASLCLYDENAQHIRQGYVSNLLSNGQCELKKENENESENGTSLTIDFSDNLLYARGFIIYFDTLNNIYPTSFDIEISKTDSTDMIVEKINNNTSAVYEFIPEDPLTDVEQIVLKFYTMNRPFVRLRISKIILGLIKQYSADELTESLTCEYDLDPTGNRLPQQKASFTLYTGDDNPYSPDNPNGYYAFVKERQPLSVKLLIKDNADNLTDTIELCDMMLSDSITAQRDTVTFNAETYLTGACEKYSLTLSDLTDDDGNPQTSISLYDMLTLDKGDIKGVFPAMDLPLTADGRKRWIIDESLKGITTTASIDGIALKECVQMIAQAACCVVYEDAEGIIHIEKLPNRTEHSSYTYDKMFGVPSLERYAELKEVQVYIYKNGEKEDTAYILKNSSTGEIEEIDNPLITDESRAEAVAEYIAGQLNYRNRYTAEIIGGVELEPFDTPTVQTRYAENVQALLVKKSLKYNGAVNCDIQYMICDTN